MIRKSSTAGTAASSPCSGTLADTLSCRLCSLGSQQPSFHWYHGRYWWALMRDLPRFSYPRMGAATPSPGWISGGSGKKSLRKCTSSDPGGWGVPATVTTELGFPYPTTFFHKMLPPVHGKVFMVTSIGYILGLDLATASFFALELPVGVGNNTYMLSCAEDSGIYLVSTDGFQLNVWLHRMTGHDGGAGGWLPVDTFCVREACARLAGHNWVSRDGDYIDVTAVGDNAEFVFLDHRASGIVLYVHLRSRVVEKVFDRQLDSDYMPLSSSQIFPLMMIWPPIFPALSG
uniref:Uncharacterized protein n=1 Tax=Avena sativa TaxID=4498 RepID=A0ACD5WKL6_AVESA